MGSFHHELPSAFLIPVLSCLDDVESLPKWLSNVTSISKPMARNWDVLLWISGMTLSPELWKISGLCVLGRRDLDTKGARSIVLSRVSCVKEVTSLVVMAQVVSPSMGTNLKMRISSQSTLDQEFSPWQMLDQIRMDLNSSCAL